MPKRNEVYTAIDTERNYQDKKWGNTASSGDPGNGERTLDEFVLYITAYTNQLAVISGTTDNKIQKLNFVRKVAGLAVACMEQHGAPLRRSY